MKEIFTHGITPGIEFPPLVYEAALRRWPERQEGMEIVLKAEINSKEYEEIVAFFKEHGIHPRPPFTSWREAGGTFPVWGIREISSQKLDDSEFLVGQKNI